MFKKVIAGVSLLTLGSACANVKYPAYVDIMVIYSSIPYKISYLLPGMHAQGVKTTGVNFRVALGYQFNRYIAAELGELWAFWPTYVKVISPPINNFQKNIGNQRVKNNILYLVAKVGMPLGKYFEVYVKGGIGSVARDGFRFNNKPVIPSKLIPVPIYGLGLLIHVTKRFSAEGMWMQTPARSSDKLPTANFAGIGFQYNFAIF